MSSGHKGLTSSQQQGRFAAAPSLPSGASFRRCALQVNPHHYSATFRGDASESGEAEYVARMIEKAQELEISVLAVTDHNSVSSIEAFRAAAQGTGVHVFPGFELSSSEGVHVLCIYPMDADQSRLERYLGEFGIHSTDPSSDLSKSTLLEILVKVPEQGGVAIAAHAASDTGGLLRVLKGQARVQVWRSPCLQAIQIPKGVEDLPTDLRRIIENKDAAYRRESPVDERLALAVLNARDVANPEDLGHPRATCQIKMSEVGIEGLRQAFLDPGSRIRLNRATPRTEADPQSELVALSWEGGFFDGAALHFNPNLNVLIGGRGAGKSTVIESLRAVLGLEAVGEEARKVHQGIVRNVLGTATKISLLVRTRRPSLREYRIERTLPNPPVVREEGGSVSQLGPLEVLPGIEVYGQHEISELTKSPEKLTRLLDRFVDRDPSAAERKSSLRRRLANNRRRLVEARSQAEELGERLDTLPGLEETLERYREAGLAERLGEKSLLIREERLLESIPERLATFRECREMLSRELPVDKEFLSEKALEGLPGRDILGRLVEVLDRLEQSLREILQALEEALAVADESIEGVKREWQDRKQIVEREYESILRELQKSRLDGEEFVRLQHRIETLRPLRDRLQKCNALVRELQSERSELVTEWEDQKAKASRALQGAAKSVSRKLRDRVEVRVKAAGNREPLAVLLREEVGGRLQEAIDQLGRREDLSLPHFVGTCRRGAEALAEEYALPPGAAERMASAGSEVLLKIEELELPTTTELLLNTALKGEPPVWQTLEELSTGQKATAVLLLLLLESDAPLIVDQPEDDLDNRFITEDVVPRMRAEKQRRQFLFSTHNANIPVLGDAELIVGLVASGDQAAGASRLRPELMGSIDAWQVRELIEEVLEGGKDAFERRRQKYGF